jgi:DNA-binding NarL/FixJ family response regulator
MLELRKKILCIVDDTEDIALIGQELADRGFEPIVAYNGYEGFVAILRRRPDLVLWDINMPIMSGFEVSILLHTIINARLTDITRNETWPKLTVLNDREIETLTWVARGKTSAQIARILHLAKRTVDFHLDNAREKLGAVTRTQAAIKAAIDGVILP